MTAFDKAAVAPADELTGSNTEANTMTSTPNDVSKVGVSAPTVVSAADAARIAAERKVRARRRLLSSSPLLMFGVLIVLFAFFTAMHPDTFPSFANVKNMLMDTAILMVMAVGVTYVMIAAGFDLSIGSVLVFGQVVAAKVMSGIGGQGAWTIVVGVVVSVLAGVVWGLFNGWVITKLRVPPLITTLGSLGAALGVAYLLTNGADVRDVPDAAYSIATGKLLGLSWIVWTAVVVVVIGGLVLHLTRFGRHTFVIGSNAEAARRSGINVDRHLIKLYCIAGGLSGFAGMMSLIRYTTTTVGGHGTDSLVVITGVALGGISLFGGIGLMIGSVIGMFIPTVLNNGLVSTNVSAFWQQVAIGLILIGAVYLDQLKRSRRDQP
ncbi:ribose transport system permease protein [Nakamurella sp. UYEF19]|uniref:ABC transporter permease n=1 Tax=Nakamurella sp. UYEF19 TaxID=1756392 RepID=UPI003393076E